MAKILLIEDDARIASFVQRGLAAEGHGVDHRDNGRDGLDLARQRAHDLVILDRSLPFMNGADVCRALRDEGHPVCVLMLTAHDSLGDKIDGLRGGADDYMTKPFAFDELVARVEALLRRGPGAVLNTTVLTVGDLRLDLGRKRLTRDGHPVPLTAKEFRLLEYLMRHPGEVVSRQRLLNNVWDKNYDPGTKVIDVYVRYLRRKLDQGGEESMIRTVRGFGYKINAPGSASGS